MKLTMRKLVLCASTALATLGCHGMGHAFAPTRLNRVLYKIAPLLPQSLQSNLATIELYWLIEEFLDNDNARPLKYFFEQAALFVQKNREFVKDAMKPELDETTKEAVVDSLIKHLHYHKTGTRFEWIALSFFPLSRKYFPDEMHPFIKKHLEQLKFQLRRRTNLNKGL